MPTAVGQLRLAQHAAQDSYQDGPSFAELSRDVLVVRVGNKYAGHMTSVMTQDIEDAVHRFVSQRRRLTFTVLSHAFPQCTWQTLFQVLHHLQEKDLVVLTPLLWDYEICAQEEIVRTDGGTT